MRSGADEAVDLELESTPVEVDAPGPRRFPLRARTIAVLAAVTALLIPLVWQDVVPSIVSMAVTSGDPEPVGAASSATVVDGQTTTTAPADAAGPAPATTTPLTGPAPTTISSTAGPAPTTTSPAAKSATAPTTTAATSTPSPWPAQVPLPPLPLPSVSIPPPSPTVTLFPLATAGSMPTGIVAGPDGNLWFTEGNRDVVGRISPQGTITEFRTPTPHSQPMAITVGPDRNMWFTEVGANKVARITPAGVVTEYPIPTPYSRPQGGITTGPDGALWFTEYNTATVGRIDLAGHVTEFPRTDTPGEIVAGADGYLWFTGVGPSLFRMSTDGAMSPVAVGDLTSVYALTVDRAGNLWYAGSNPETGRVVRRDASGRLTEFTIAGRDQHFTGMTEGPDGAIWIASGSRHTIYRLALNGTLTTFSAPSPESITTGPDGNIWFTSGTYGNAIGRIDIS